MSGGKRAYGGELRRAFVIWFGNATQREAERGFQLLGAVDEARWHLGKDFPEVAALAEYLIMRDRRWSGIPGPDVTFPWSPPEHVTDITAFKRWLRERNTPEI